MADLTPSRTITIAGKDYVLDGSFATLRKIQEHFTNDIVRILIGIMDMSLNEVAILIAIASTQPDKSDEIGQGIIDEVGPLTKDYLVLKTNLIAWLTVAISPKADREKKRAEMEAIIERQKAPPASPGESTASSA